jgi:hypothetical protein
MQKAMLAVAAAVAYWASAATQDGIMDEAAAILDRYVEAAGGKAAHLRLRDRTVKLRIELGAQGIVIQGTIVMARPNRTYTLLESEVTGKIERGTDGQTAWSDSVTTGPQLLDGQERAELFYLAQFDRLADWRAFHSKAVAAGMGEAAGRPCRKVEVTPKEAKTQSLCFDAETGLLASSAMRVKSPMGEVEVTSLSSDYREVDGVKLAFRTASRVMGQERVTIIEQVTHNTGAPESRFAPPAALAVKQ